MGRIEYDEIEIGSVVSFVRQLRAEDVKIFSVMTGDKNPLHIDEDFGRKSIFGDNIVHGMLLAGFFSAIVGQCFSENVVYLSQTLEFRRPAFVGDEIRIEGVVDSRSDSTKIVGVRTSITREEDLIVTGKAKIKFLS